MRAVCAPKKKMDAWSVWNVLSVGDEKVGRPKAQTPATAAAGAGRSSPPRRRITNLVRHAPLIQPLHPPHDVACQAI